MADAAWRFLRRGAGQVLRRNVDVTVDGIEHVPTRGPVILAARHYHHLYDGCIVVATIPRPVHILVGLDWVQNRAAKLAMDRLCRAARWPVVLRRDGETPVDDREAARALRQAMRDAIQLLHEGRVLLVFPEGYPTVDPGYTPKRHDDDFLPFQPGVISLARAAARRGIDVPIVPVGFTYEPGERWSATMRPGPPMTVSSGDDPAQALQRLERAVRQLSGLAAAGDMP